MLIFLSLNIYMAKILRIDICYLLAQSTEHEITLLIVSQIETRRIIYVSSNIVLCGLNARSRMSADDCFHNNNNIIIVIIILVLLHFFFFNFFFFFFQKILKCYLW